MKTKLPSLTTFAATLAALLTLKATAQPVLITAPQTLNPGATTITPTAGGAPIPLATADITVRGTTLTMNGRHTIRNLVLENNAVVTHAAAFTFDYSGGAGTDVVNGMWLNVQANPEGNGGNLTVEPGSSIDVSGRGFALRSGPGAGSDGYWPVCGSTGTGAGHGGRGGPAGSCCVSGTGVAAPGGTSYGSVASPTAFGSGGGNTTGGAGGGVIRLIVTGTLTINGAVRANGSNASSQGGGGSGGSVWVYAAEIFADGSVTASGGAGGSGAFACDPGGAGGAGGRVAIYFGSSTLTGAISAFGGSGVARGGAGTVWLKQDAAPTGDLRVINAGTGGSTPIPPSVTTVGELLVDGGVDLIIDTPLSLVNGTIRGASTRLSHSAGSTAGLTLIASGDLTVEPGASIDVSGRGFAARSGPGAGSDGLWPACGSTGSGGGHGGRGGSAGSCCVSGTGVVAPGGASYGSVTNPTTLGSGGGSANGGAGGGTIRLNVGGTLTVNGSVRANGVVAPSSTGGGAGGSVWIDAAQFVLNGSVTALGGAGGAGSYACDPGAGGGAGGRIAIYFGTSTLSGTVTAFGGSGVVRGGAGTVWLKQHAAPTGELRVVDNGAGGTTPLPTSFTSTGELLVDGGVDLIIDTPLSLVNGTIRGTSTRVSHSAGNAAGLTLIASGDLMLQSGASIDVSGRGFGARTGPGAGSDGGYPLCAGTVGSGGGHGGVGDGAGSCCVFGQGRVAPGGAVYGSVTNPTTLGSGGGVIPGGGAGGGAIRLSIAGMLTVDGAIRANGGSAATIYGGGGSGGSIWIDAPMIVASAPVTALRGAPGLGGGCNPGGGRGGGGRIAVYSCSLAAPSGTFVADNGTIYLDPDGMLIREQPGTSNVCPGSTAQLEFDVLGATSFQWTRDGIPLTDGPTPTGAVISGSQTSLLSITGILLGDEGVYRCSAASACGSLESNPATLTICLGDFNCDGGINGEDIESFFLDWEAGNAAADINEDGGIDGSDVELFFLRWEAGC